MQKHICCRHFWAIVRKGLFQWAVTNDRDRTRLETLTKGLCIGDPSFGIELRLMECATVGGRHWLRDTHCPFIGTQEFNKRHSNLHLYLQVSQWLIDPYIRRYGLAAARTHAYTIFFFRPNLPAPWRSLWAHEQRDFCVERGTCESWFIGYREGVCTLRCLIRNWNWKMISIRFWQDPRRGFNENKENQSFSSNRRAWGVVCIVCMCLL